MDPASVKSTLQNLAFGNVMAAAARNYQKELLANEKAPATSSVNQEVDLDELMDVSSEFNSILCFFHALFNFQINFNMCIWWWVGS